MFTKEQLEDLIMWVESSDCYSCDYDEDNCHNQCYYAEAKLREILESM